MIENDLLQYARHLNHCDRYKHPAEPGPRKCTCGLDELLDTAAAKDKLRVELTARCYELKALLHRTSSLLEEWICECGCALEDLHARTRLAKTDARKVL